MKSGFIRPVLTCAAALVFSFGFSNVDSTNLINTYKIVCADETGDAEILNTWTGDRYNLNSKTYKLENDIDTKGRILVSNGVEAVIDLNGHKIDRGLVNPVDNGSVIIIESGGKLTLMDSSGRNEGIITGGAETNGGGIINHGTLIMEGGTISGNKTKTNGFGYGFGGGIFNDSSDKSGTNLVINGGIIKGNVARIGGGVYSNKQCSMEIGSVKVYENDAVLGGGVFSMHDVVLKDAPVIIKNDYRDLFIVKNKKLILNESLDKKAEIGFDIDSEEYVFTSGLNGRDPTKYFYADAKSCAILKSDDGEALYRKTVAVLTYGDKQESFKNADDAWAAAKGKNGAVLKLYDQWLPQYRLYIGSDYNNITLDLNGQMLMRQGNGYESDGGEVIRVQPYNKITIIDSDPENRSVYGLGGFIRGGSSGTAAGALHLTDYSQCIIKGGTFADNVTAYHGGAIYIGNGAKLTMIGGGFENNETKDSTDKSHGGAIYNDGGEVLLQNVFFKRNKSENSGGAVYMNKGYMQFRNCTFENNTSQNHGGAVAIDGENVEFFDVTFQNNSANDNGGAIWINDDRIFICNCVMKNNKSNSEGGGIYVDSMNDVNIQGKAYIYENTDSQGQSNVCLQDGISTQAYIYDGGLTEGSKIGLDKTGDTVKNGTKLVSNATKYEFEAGYFVADKGRIEFQKLDDRQEIFMATAINPFKYALYILIGLELVGAFVVIFNLLFRRRTKAKKL